MQVSGRGCFVFSWKQVELDGLTNSPPDAMRTGSCFCWRGQAMRVDDPRNRLTLGDGVELARFRERVRLQVARQFPELTLDLEDPETNDNQVDANEFQLTDGKRVFQAAILLRQEAEPLILAFGDIPPPETELWVLRHGRMRSAHPETAQLICFLPGAMVETPQGPRPVEDILPGDSVWTRDNGPKMVLWRGMRALSASRMMAFPRQRPVRIRAGALGDGDPHPDLRLSPDHRLLLRDRAASMLFGEEEVLVAARDLVGQPGITRDSRPGAVQYLHLMLDGHQIMRVNGVDCESFHPGQADLSSLDPREKDALDRIMPGLAAEPWRFGQYARRLLTRAEAALFLHGLATQTH